MANYKVGDPVEVLYVPGSFQSGETDCKVEIFDEAGVEIASSPFDMVEKDDGAATPNLLGVYGYSFTADAAGIWTAKAYRLIGGNKRYAKIIKYDVRTKDVDDLATSTEVGAVETKVDDANTNLGNVEDKIDILTTEVDEISEGGQIL